MTCEISGTRYHPDGVSGALDRDGAESPVDGAEWFVSETGDGGLVYEVGDGGLAGASWLTADALLDGTEAVQFRLTLSGGDREFFLVYSLLPQCEARIRLPLSSADQSQWALEREGAWCDPMTYGDAIDPADVERIELRVLGTGDGDVRWCLTSLVAAEERPPRLDDPTLPEGPLLDEFGQSALQEWDGRTESESALVERLRRQRDRAGDRDHPGDGGERLADRDRWGGWTGREFEATGFFRTEHDGDRWWLVTPDGHPFWSAGLDCVTPDAHTRYEGVEPALEWLPDDEAFADAFDHWSGGDGYVDYLVANLVRAFGPEEWRDAWETVAVGQLRGLGFNTVGNWSDWRVASEEGLPYVRPLELDLEAPTVFRDFPDVYHESFPDAAADLASDLAETADDPAMIGYFLGNEPEWGFAQDPPAAGMLRTTETCATRRELADWLRDRHGDGGLAEAWGMDVTIDDVREGRWTRSFSETAQKDLETFSAAMVERLYRVLCDACREVDPNHLVLGSRFVGVPEEWALAGMDHVDVVSLNCYRPRVPAEYADFADAVDAPVLVGEFHFGAPDAGLPSAGVVSVPDQAARGDAYRVYLEDAAAQPWCVGAHYFQMYDQSALGRFDGEAFNIGLLDVCHRPYRPLAEAARESHGRLYELATGEVAPFDDEPEYLNAE